MNQRQISNQMKPIHRLVKTTDTQTSEDDYTDTQTSEDNQYTD